MKSQTNIKKGVIMKKAIFIAIGLSLVAVIFACLWSWTHPAIEEETEFKAEEISKPSVPDPEPAPVVVEPVVYSGPDTNYPRTLTKSGGVYYEECGLVEKWYSSQTLPHYRMNEWVADANGFYRCYQNGIWYFVVAYTMDTPIGTPIQISMGPALVLDHCESPGVIDVYVNWNPY